MKYESSSVRLTDFEQFNQSLQKDFPICHNNLHATVNVPNTQIPIGKSKLTLDADTMQRLEFTNTWTDAIEWSLR